MTKHPDNINAKTQETIFSHIVFIVSISYGCEYYTISSPLASPVGNSNIGMLSGSGDCPQKVAMPIRATPLPTFREKWEIWYRQNAGMGSAGRVGFQRRNGGIRAVGIGQPSNHRAMSTMRTPSRSISSCRVRAIRSLGYESRIFFRGSSSRARVFGSEMSSDT